jgi:hypothetical protein
VRLPTELLQRVNRESGVTNLQVSPVGDDATGLVRRLEERGA